MARLARKTVARKRPGSQRSVAQRAQATRQRNIARIARYFSTKGSPQDFALTMAREMVDRNPILALSRAQAKKKIADKLAAGLSPNDASAKDIAGKIAEGQLKADWDPLLKPKK